MTIKKRTKYSDEFKEEAVKLITEQGYKVTEAARNLGIHDSLLRRWIRNGNPENSQSIADNAKLQAELKRLKKENAQLKMEREILKKAAAFFAKKSV